MPQVVLALSGVAACRGGKERSEETSTVKLSTPATATASPTPTWTPGPIPTLTTQAPLQPPAKAPAPPPTKKSVYYANCKEARAAGAAPHSLDRAISIAELNRAATKTASLANKQRGGGRNVTSGFEALGPSTETDDVKTGAFVRRKGSDARPVEILLASHDGYAQEQRDAENEEFGLSVTAATSLLAKQ